MVKLNNEIYDLATPPSFESENFEELLKNGEFGEFEAQAIELRSKGFCHLKIKNKKWLENIDHLRDDLIASDEFKKINKKKPTSIRFQDAWLNKKLLNVKKIATELEILNCLSYLFGREPFPFQTLNFPYGTRQHFHSDAVHFNSLPNGFMCGVWVAMEDIQEDSGPLVYYPYSHRTPYISSKSLGITKEIIEKASYPQLLFEKYWEDLVENLHLKQEKFIPKKGELIIWHANLIHGGGKVIQNKLTRWSQVTHYFFKNCAYYTPLFDTMNQDLNNERKWRTPQNLLEN